MNQPAHAPEDMAAFFDDRAAGYERHMFAQVEDVSAFYASLADALPREPTSPDVLDLGIGTGLELDALFDRFPNASVTGIDLSAGMLRRLARKRHRWPGRVSVVTGSFLTLDFGTQAYDAVVSSMALHHWIPSIKLDLYRRVRATLRPNGVFVNADYVVSANESNRRLQAFTSAGHKADHHQHIDLPLPEEREIDLLRQAGFGMVTVTFRRSNACTFRATVPRETREATD